MTQGIQIGVGPTVAVTKPDQPSRSSRDTHHLAVELVERRTALSSGGRSLYDPADPDRKFKAHALIMVGEFERNRIVVPSRDGFRIVNTRSRSRGYQPKLTVARKRQGIRPFDGGEHTPTEIGRVLRVSRQTVSRVVQRARQGAAA